MNKSIGSTHKSFLTLFLSTSFLLSCAQKFDSTKSGVQYRIVTHGNATKVKAGDYMVLDFVTKYQFNGKDSVLQSTYKMKKPAKIMVQPTRGYGDLMDVFALLSEKDSAIVKLAIDSLFNPKKGRPMPPNFKPKSFFMVEVKVQRVLDQKHFQAMADSERKTAMAKEKIDLAKYLADNKLKPDSTKAGLMYIIRQQGNGPVAKVGDTVQVNYTGKMLDGKVFDTNDSSSARANKLYNPQRKMMKGYDPMKFAVGRHQVIAGWDSAFLFLKKGTKATLIIPSKLAYGQMDQPTIPAYSTLIFDVDLKDVTKGKPAPPFKPMMPPMRPGMMPQPLKPGLNPKASPAKPGSGPAKPTAAVPSPQKPLAPVKH